MNHVFVDFENVPSVNLSLIRGQPAKVTLLIGEKQRRLELDLVRQIHEHASQVSLVEVGASGRNALDMVLAWHLGAAAERSAGDAFFVVSKDKDFDPLIKHLRARGLAVERVDAFAALPFVAALEAASIPRAARTRGATAGGRTRGRSHERPAARAAAATSSARQRLAEQRDASTPATEPTTDARLTKLIDRLQHRPKARPVRRKTLLSHINGFFGNQLSAAELEAVVADLQTRGVVAIDPQGRVSYPAQP
jgi:hypothetical protein